jgi:hypothetical protein
MSVEPGCTKEMSLWNVQGIAVNARINFYQQVVCFGQAASIGCKQWAGATT